MITKVKRLYEQVRSKVISLLEVELTNLREKIETHIDDLEAKDPELQNMSDLVARLLLIWKRLLNFDKSLK